MTAADLATRADVDRVLAAVADLRDQMAQIVALVAPTAPEPAMMSVRQYAARAGLSPCTIRRRIADGTIAHVRVGGSIRLPASALQVADRAEIATMARAARGQV